MHVIGIFARTGARAGHVVHGVPKKTEKQKESHRQFSIFHTCHLIGASLLHRDRRISLVGPGCIECLC